jgi:hypothetical protein
MRSAQYPFRLNWRGPSQRRVSGSVFFGKSGIEASTRLQRDWDALAGLIQPRTGHAQPERGTLWG